MEATKVSGDEDEPERLRGGAAGAEARTQGAARPRAAQAGQPTDRPMIGMPVVIVVVFMIIAIGGRTATPAILWDGGLVYPRRAFARRHKAVIRVRA